MTTTQTETPSQRDLWNGPGGEAWVAAQAVLDRAFESLEHRLAEAADAASARHVLDIGCGTGATTVAIARRLGDGGRCLGVDVSQPMLDAARTRAERAGVAARFVCSDAETHRFESASVDRIVSRFGVMFFADPVRAFANLRGAARDGHHLHCLTWRSPEDNPFMTTAARAAEPLLPGVAEPPPTDTGQFGLSDRSRLQEILDAGGWRDVDITPLDVPCAFPAAGLELYVTRLGSVGRRLLSEDDATRDRVVEAVLPAFEPYRQGDTIRFTAACWEVEARAGA